jgi:peptidoglycan hydrolase CwlO-like protein
MTTLQDLQKAVDDAQTVIGDRQADLDKANETLDENISRIEALHARKAAIKQEIDSFEASMISAVASGADVPQTDIPNLQAEMNATDKVIAAFPTTLTSLRENVGRKHAELQMALGALVSANFDLATFEYRKAMEKVWSVVDQVHMCAAAYSTKPDLTGLADSRHAKFGRLP